MAESNKEYSQKQVAGRNSEQYQVIINQGISEERVREVFNEMVPQVLKNYSVESYDIANRRITKLENIVIPKIIEREEFYSSFRDPSFQMLLRKAQQAAAQTDNHDDYTLLSELIICHINKGDDRKNRTGISKAIEIVDDIDNDALCALTVAHAIQSYRPLTGDVREGIKLLDDLFSKLIYMELPKGNDWMDHLDILGAIRISTFGKLKPFRDLLFEYLNGYVCVGIKNDSEQYKQAKEKLKDAGIPTSILVENELLEGYSRLNIESRSSISELRLRGVGVNRPISEGEIKILKDIWNMYSYEDALIQKVKDEFIKILDSFSGLKATRIWWENIPCPFEITKVGRVLAHTNAKRCDPDLPDLNL